MEDRVLVWQLNRGDATALARVYEKYRADLLTLVSYRMMVAFHDYGLTEEHATCETARKHFESTDGWLSPLPSPRTLLPTTYIGWIYWANRGHWTDLTPSNHEGDYLVYYDRDS